MKKSLLPILCLTLLAPATSIAQNNNRGQFGPRQHPSNRNELLADTAITNHMGLTEDQLILIEEINSNYKDKLLQTQRSNTTADGKRMGRQDWSARLEQFKALRRQFRSQLHDVLGDELYIQYLEESIERQPAMATPRGGMHQGQRMGGRRNDNFPNEDF